jgi:bacterioferritin (cytochrome b1)
MKIHRMGKFTKEFLKNNLTLNRDKQEALSKIIETLCESEIQIVGNYIREKLKQDYGSRISDINIEGKSVSIKVETGVHFLN